MALTKRVRRVEFAILGPLEVMVDGRPADIGGIRQRALLAVLLIRANEVVPTDRIIEEVWGDDPPPTAAKMVQIFVSRLRMSLGEGAANNTYLITRPPGYLLAVPEAGLDLARFRTLVGEARSIMAQDPGTAAATLRAALSLWRGAPLSDLALEPFAQLAIPRLEELRLAAVEDRIDADLAIGRGGDLVAELRDLIAEYPLRERFQVQLMRALYRAGRQAEALDVYTRARAGLARELGIEPGPELQRVQGAILRQESWLDPPVNRQAAGPARPEGNDGVPTESVIVRPAATSVEVRRRRSVLVAAALVGVAGLSLAFALSRPSPPTETSTIRPTANSVAIVDPSTDALVADVSVGAAPGPIAAADGSIWIGNVEDHTLTRIDVPSLKVVKTFGLSSAPTALSATKGIVWIGNGFAGTLSRVLIAYDQLSAPFFPGPKVSGVLAVSGTPDDLWVGLADQTLIRLDPSSLQPRTTLQLPVRVRALTVTADAAWILEFRDNAIARIDLASGAPTASITPVGTAVAISSGFGSIWVATADRNELLRIDPESGHVDATVPLSFAPTGMVADAGAVWIAGGPDGSLARVDPHGQALTTSVTMGHPIGGIAVANGDVWLTID